MFPGDWKVRDAESGERACSADRREGDDVSSDPQCSWEKPAQHWGVRWGGGRVLPGGGQLARLIDTLKK